MIWGLGLTALLLAGCNNGSADGPSAKPAVTAKNTALAKPEVVMYKAPNCECCTG